MLSASIIVKNESAVLERCLKSLHGIDNIVVVDTGSTDGTPAIARKYTPHVYEGEYKWSDDFAHARNFALGKIKSGWVITIDADEELAPGQISTIREEIKQAEAEGRKTIVCRVTAMGSNETHFQPRIYKRHPDVYWKNPIHNVLSVCDGVATGIQLYYGYSPAHKFDPDRALRILKKEYRKNPDNPRTQYYLAREYYYRMDYDTALEYYMNCTSSSTKASERADAALMCAKCLVQKDMRQMAAHWALKAVWDNPQYKEAWLTLMALAPQQHRDRWGQIAQGANNTGVLFVRT